MNRAAGVTSRFWVNVWQGCWAMAVLGCWSAARVVNRCQKGLNRAWQSCEAAHAASHIIGQ